MSLCGLGGLGMRSLRVIVPHRWVAVMDVRLGPRERFVGCVLDAPALGLEKDSIRLEKVTAQRVIFCVIQRMGQPVARPSYRDWRSITTMNTKRLKRSFIIIGSAVLATWAAPGQPQTNIAPEADRVLSAACQYLAQAPYFSLNAEVWREHVTASGQKLQFSRRVSMEVKRPNRLHMEIASPHSQRGFWYDGKSLTILDREPGLFSMAAMPNVLDAALDKAHDQFGIDLPLADLAVSDPYKNATAKVLKGAYYGLSPVLGINCHHLAFTQENVDWQIWIEDGPHPLIRKLVITHKNEQAMPEFTALITDWDLTDRIAESDFAFEAPRGASKIEMLPDQAMGGESSQVHLPLTNPKNK